MERLSLFQQIIGSLSCFGICAILHVLMNNPRHILKELGYEIKEMAAEYSQPEPETEVEPLTGLSEA